MVYGECNKRYAVSTCSVLFCRTVDTVAYYVTLCKRGQWTHITTIHSRKSDNWESCGCLGFTRGDEAINRMSTSSELLKSSQWITFSYKSCYWACCVSVLVCWARRAARWGDRCPGYAGVLGPDIDISTPLDSTTTVDTSIKRTYPLPSFSGWVKRPFSFSPFYGANSQNKAFDRDGVSTLLKLE